MALSAINSKTDAARFLNSKSNVSAAHPTPAQLKREARVLVSQVKTLEKTLEKTGRVTPSKIVPLLVRIVKFSKKVLKVATVAYASGIGFLASYRMYQSAMNQIFMGLDDIFGRTSMGSKIVTGPARLLIGATIVTTSKIMQRASLRMIFPKAHRTSRLKARSEPSKK
jgi:hypothetical protein